MTSERMTVATALILAFAVLMVACSGAGDDAAVDALGITTTTIAASTTATPSTTSTSQPSSTTLDADVSPSRLVAGDLTPTRYGTSEFAYALTFELPNGAWSTDEETRVAVHLAQSPTPDFAADASYDFPLLVLLALPELDDSAVVELIRDIEDIGFTTATETDIDGRPAVVAEGASRNNPLVPALVGEDGQPWAGLGGYWYWDPDITGILYRTWVIDMSRGTLLAWYAAPRAAFDANVAAATATVASIHFTG